MALYFYKKPIMSSASTLKDLTTRYGAYTSRSEYPTVDKQSYDNCESTIALVQSGIRLLKEGQENLEKHYNEIREEYKSCKNKSERKEIMLEIEQIEEESNLHSIITEAHRLRYMLEARLDEARCARDRMAIDLGYLSHSTSNLQSIDVEERECVNANPEENSAIITEITPESSTPPNTTVGGNIAQATPQTTCRSVKPPRVSLPKFHGSAEEFPEYWAIFETLVHNSPDLAVIEKILLLKESLVGKAQNSIKGIRLIPDNYNWIIETLHKNYLNQPTNRAQIVQKLINMKPAANTAEICSTVFDNIQVLVHQMISAGHDVRRTCEPVWHELILAKFPRDIVKPVLLNGRSKDQQTVEDLMTQLKEEISAIQFIECRLGHANKPNEATRANHPRPQYSDKCIFCHRNNHSSLSCRTITDQGRRRKIIMEENRCWKCFSPNHNSFECQEANCTRCGQNHHVSLCVKQGHMVEGQIHLWHPNQVKSRENPPSRNHNPGSFRNDRFSGLHGNQHRNHCRAQVNQSDSKKLSNVNTHMGLSNTVPLASEQNHTSSQLVLMTAEGDLWNYKKEKYEKVLFLFDSGAQKTVIEQRIAEQFNLPRSTTEICTMSGIGGHTDSFESSVVTAKVCTAFGEELNLSIQTKPVLTSGFPSVKLTNMDTDFLKVNNICLANSKLRGEHQCPHILVGLDHYHELVLSQDSMGKTPTGLHVAKTIFGPTLYGKGLLVEEAKKPKIFYEMTAIVDIYNPSLSPDNNVTAKSMLSSQTRSKVKKNPADYCGNIVEERPKSFRGSTRSRGRYRPPLRDIESPLRNRTSISRSFKKHIRPSAIDAQSKYKARSGNHEQRPHYYPLPYCCNPHSGPNDRFANHDKRIISSGYLSIRNAKNCIHSEPLSVCKVNTSKAPTCASMPL